MIDMIMDDDVEMRERDFHNSVRQYIIGCLSFIILYVLSYCIICTFRRRVEREDIFYTDAEDAFVYRVSLWLNVFTLAVSAGAVLLLPISIVLNEALLVFPNSYYLQWVNVSLIHGLWNSIFLASNLSLFILIPFAYLFAESEGLPGSKKGIMSRFKEALLMLVLLCILVAGIAWVVIAFIGHDQSNRETLFDIWNFYLPYLYSCISLLGVLMLLICTPVGFARMFTVMGDVIVKPEFLRDLDEELQAASFEEANLKRRLGDAASTSHNHYGSLSNGNGCAIQDLDGKLEEAQKHRREIEKRKKASSVCRNLGYLLVMLILLALTTICALMVVQNTIELLIGLKALPVHTKEIVLGISSLSALGPFGAAIEVTLILYLMLASVVGFYSLPFFRRLRPKRQDTPMMKIIGNCVVILVLSSALPVLSRALGITNFDLLGNFGRLEWLGNFYIILTYNLIFAGATALCLVTRFTSSVRQALWRRLNQLSRRVVRRKTTLKVE